MLIEINRLLTADQVQALYGLPEPLLGKIMPLLPVALAPDGENRLYLESEIDQFLTEFVRRQRLAEARANPPAKGRPGRKVETEEIAVYADELRRKRIIWKKVFKACKERWPNDERVDNEEQVRGTWNRFFGKKRRKQD